jgi:hypothetical protein
LAAAAADQRLLCAQVLIADIAAEVENDLRKTLSGSWGDDQTISPTLNKDLKLSQKTAKWWCQLKANENEEGASLSSQSVHSDFCRCFFTILDNVLIIGELAEGEERASRPHPHPGGLLEGSEEGCENSAAADFA